MSRFRLSRRTVLRGIGGATVALPSLEVMHGFRGARGAVEGITKRFFLGWGGISIAGGDCCVGNLELRNQYSWPTKPGLDWELTRGLAPVGGSQKKWQSPHESFTWGSLKTEVGVVSGLNLPTDEPWKAGVHGSSNAPQLAGTAPGGGYLPLGPTADQIVADALPAGPQRRSIALSVQPMVYGVQNEGEGPLPADRTLSPVATQPSPVNAFKTIFNMTGPSAANPAAIAELIKRRKSVIDLVKDNSATLVSHLGGEDKRRMQKYFDEVRSLETRLEKFATDPSCGVPNPPAADPPSGGIATTEEFNQAQKDGDIEKPTEKCWSNEIWRGELMTDVIALAFQCNITPVAFLKITNTKSFMSVRQLCDYNGSMHGATHGSGSPSAIADIVGWHVQVFARLIAKLKGMSEADGSSVLDHTAMGMLFEGGGGETTPQEKMDREANGWFYAPGTLFAHSMEHLMVVYAGGRALGLKPQHTSFPLGDFRTPAEVVLTLMNAVGVPGPLGMVKRTVDEMGSIPKLQ